MRDCALLSFSLFQVEESLDRLVLRELPRSPSGCWGLRCAGEEKNPAQSWSTHRTALPCDSSWRQKRPLLVAEGRWQILTRTLHTEDSSEQSFFSVKTLLTHRTVINHLLACSPTIRDTSRVHASQDEVAAHRGRLAHDTPHVWREGLRAVHELHDLQGLQIRHPAQKGTQERLWDGDKRQKVKAFNLKALQHQSRECAGVWTEVNTFTGWTVCWQNRNLKLLETDHHFSHSTP